MKTKEPNMTRPLIPWLVQASDLRRYLGRACRQCLRGRVIMFYARTRSGPGRTKHPLLCLCRLTCPDVLTQAAVDFERGRFRRVRLSTLKAITGRSTKPFDQQERRAAK
jgi:hypothetical protein